METEIQKRRTFEILAKYIGQKHDITIDFQPDKVQCDIKTRRIILPSNIKTENIYPAIAWVMHEAAHIKYTTFDAEKIVDDYTDFMILNSVEDIRIDRENFNLLPNIKGIYTEMIKFVGQRNKELLKDAPIENRVLCDAIMIAEGFRDYTSKDPAIRDFIYSTGMLQDIEGMIHQLNNLSRYGSGATDVKKSVKEIREKLIIAKDKLTPPPLPPPPLPTPGNPENSSSGQSTSNDGDGPDPEGQSTTSNDGDGPSDPEKSNKPEESNGGKQDKTGVPSGSEGKNKNQKSNSGDKLDLSATERTQGGGISGAIFGELEKNPSNPSALGAASLHERTRSDFKELLNIKERHRVNDGTRLNTDSLISFFTGDIEELFEDETLERKKKSKLILLLDSSGSMGDRCLDRNIGLRRYEILVQTVKSIADILDEVQMLDGLDVDYEVRAFDHSYKKLNKDKWIQEYTANVGGGTNLQNAFKEAQEELLNDYTIEGRRMVVAVTDGEVDNDQLESIHNCIIRNNADVRALIIGIGAEPNGGFVKKISGHNILDSEHADAVLLDAIQEMI